MKKALSLLLALVLCLSLCACGGNSNTTDISETTETTAPETNAPTENIASLKDAPEADFSNIYEECNDNIVSAKNKYVEKEYLFPGIVKDINEDSISVVPIKFSTYPYGSWYYVTVSMPQDEIMKVSTQQIVNVAGQFSNLKEKSAEMKNGAVLDDTIAFSGKVSRFLLNEDWTKHIMEVQMVSGDNTISFWFEVADVNEIENITSATINGVTIDAGDYVSGTAKMEAYGAYSDRFNVVEVLSIAKN